MIKFILLLTFSFVGCATGLCAAQDPDATTIDGYIARQARQERGEEYKDARKIVSSDLNNDATPETVVLYTIESQRGSNNYIQYVAVFVRRNGKLAPLTRTEVGGKTTRAVESIAVDHKTIQLDILDYGPKDPSCCPTIKGKTRYILVGRRLREQQARVNKNQDLQNRLR
jgi:hypothetical protein